MLKQQSSGSKKAEPYTELELSPSSATSTTTVTEQPKSSKPMTSSGDEYTDLRRDAPGGPGDEYTDLRVDVHGHEGGQTYEELGPADKPSGGNVNKGYDETLYENQKMVDQRRLR